MTEASAAGEHRHIETLLYRALDGIAAIDKRVTRTETQNEHIIAEQINASRGRGVLHEKLDDVSGALIAARHEIAAIGQRVDKIDGGFKILDAARVERLAIRTFLKNAFRKGWVIGTGGFGAGVWLWHQWDTVRDYVGRLLK